MYHGKEVFTVVGIREKELELEGDWSGGTAPAYLGKGKDWISRNGVSLIKE